MTLKYGTELTVALALSWTNATKITNVTNQLISANILLQCLKNPEQQRADSNQGRQRLERKIRGKDNAYSMS